MVNQREGDWIQTYTGKPFWPLDPRPEDVELLDIAHSLSMQCRYAGHSIKFYSVAEHSVIVSKLVSPQNALWGLLHDAAEAYVTDVPRPLKRFLIGFAAIECGVMDAVCTRFGISRQEPAEVKHIDHHICIDEKAAVMRAGPPWPGMKPTGAYIRGLPPEQAKLEFLARFHELASMRQAA